MNIFKRLFLLGLLLLIPTPSALHSKSLLSTYADSDVAIFHPGLLSAGAIGLTALATHIDYQDAKKAGWNRGLKAYLLGKKQRRYKKKVLKKRSSFVKRITQAAWASTAALITLEVLVKGFTPLSRHLRQAILSNNLEKVQRLYEHFPKDKIEQSHHTDIVYGPFTRKLYPLHIAANEGHSDIAAYLMQIQHHNPGEKLPNNNHSGLPFTASPLSIAVQQHANDMIDLFLTHQERQNFINEQYQFEINNTLELCTPLTAAIKTERLDITKQLLDAGANPENLSTNLGPAWGTPTTSWQAASTKWVTNPSDININQIVGLLYACHPPTADQNIVGAGNNSIPVQIGTQIRNKLWKKHRGNQLVTLRPGNVENQPLPSRVARRLIAVNEQNPGTPLRDIADPLWKLIAEHEGSPDGRISLESHGMTLAQFQVRFNEGLRSQPPQP